MSLRTSRNITAVCMTLIGGICTSFDVVAEDTSDATSSLTFHLRSRVETKPGSGRFHTVTKTEQWDPNKTALIVCDMWDLHHCLNATLRGAELAPRMNEVLNKARAQGVTVIHSPSSCTAAYKDHPARLRAQNMPRALKMPKEIGQWCYTIPSEEKGKYPLDQSDGGEDDEPEAHSQWAEKLKNMGRNPRSPWLEQTDLLDIHDADYISDDGEEVWSILSWKGIDNVILVGVHTNMCVLGRPFGLRQMARNGKHVVLMRDMTDTMYNPAREPYVSHFSGTDLIVEHIEKRVCPTVTSVDILGGSPFRFKNDKRPHLAIVIGEQEYETNQTLPEFALKHLGKHFRISQVFANEEDRNDLPGIDVLDDADLLLLSVRRRVLPQSQMAAVRRYVEAGKPLIGIRTANHAFSLRGTTPPPGLLAWETFDADVIGGHYTNHYGDGPQISVGPAASAAAHPLLAGVDVSALLGNGSLYVVSPLGSSATPLLIGSIPEKPAEPIAWLNTTQWGGKVYYTSLGHPDDFQNPEFNRLLRNAVYGLAKVKMSNKVAFGF